MRTLHEPCSPVFLWLPNHNENIHSEIYSLLMDTYIKDPAQRDYLLDTIEVVPCAERKVEWALCWTSDKHSSFGDRLITFAAVRARGHIFSGSSASIFRLKKCLMPGLTFKRSQTNSYLVTRVCTDFACLLFSHLKGRPHPDTVKRTGVPHESSPCQTDWHEC